MDRREFLKSSGSMLAGAGIAGSAFSAGQTPSPGSDLRPGRNPLPAWRGFNLLDFFSPDPAGARRATPEMHFKWMADWGFDFVRIPMAYPAYLDFDRSRPIKPDEVCQISERAVDRIGALIEAAHKHGLHVSLNLHRAPGYCINAGFREPFHLWTDPEALEAFCFHWEMWAKLFRHTSRAKLSFDLVNEPSMIQDMNDQHSSKGPVPGHLYRKVAEAASQAIRRISPHRIVIADGNNIGTRVIPELAGLDIAQSCRGYTPAIISHYKAPWAFKEPDKLPEPRWPGQVGGEYLGREMLEEFYKDWIALLAEGTGVHCGECGCWKQTPHSVFLAWFGDVLDILSSHGIGYALWEFSGDFGILDSGRADVEYEDWYGARLDRKLLELLKKYS